jgi:hypothetical protein
MSDDANQSLAEAMYGSTGVKKDAYVSPFDQKPAAEQPKPGEQEKPGEAKPATVDPVAVKAAAEALVKDLALDPANPLSAEVAGEFVALGLDKDQAAKIVALDEKNRESYWSKTWGDWRTESEKLPPADILAAKSFVKSYGDAELMTLLEMYHLGDNPVLIRAFARAAKGAK